MQVQNRNVPAVGAGGVSATEKPYMSKSETCICLSTCLRCETVHGRYLVEDVYTNSYVSAWGHE
jgi:hypothetical protein